MGKNNPKYIKIKEDIKKIYNIEEKYIFFKDNINDVVIIKCFIKAQKNIFLLNKKINNFKKKRNSIFNTEDFLGNFIIKNKYIYKVYSNNKIYNFTYPDFIKLIYNSLLNYEEPIVENYDTSITEYILIKPIKVKNPYTNIEFSYSQLLNFYNFCLFNNINIPILLKIFYSENFDIKSLFLNNEIYLYKLTIDSYIKNSSINKKKVY